MPSKQPTFALTVLVLFCFSLVFLFLSQLHGKSAGAEMSAPAQDEPNPFALIKNVVVNGADRSEATVSEAIVTHLGKRSGPQVGMMLYVGDEVVTGANVKLTILFLDQVAEKDNEVVIDTNTRVQLGSLFTWAGRILARVKDAFETKTERARWSVRGTEYELVVQNDGTNTLKVLKGEVQVDTGNFSPTVAEHSGESDLPPGAPLFIRAGFKEPENLPQQKQMEFVAVTGKVINLEREFIFTNRCERRHLFKISGPLNLPWFQFLGADQFAIDGRATRSITFAIKLDGTKVPIGTQESQIVAPCMDCETDPQCALGGLLLPIVVKIIDDPDGITTPEPSPTTPPAADSNVAARMEQITLPPGGRLLKATASVSQIDQTLNWSNEVIIPGEPTYSAQSVIPRYPTWEQRNQVFREARRSSILNDDSQSKERLADVYIDWGNGAKAEAELKGVVQASPERLTTLGEAYRLMGDFISAERLLRRAIGLDPAWAPALNALGNVYLDQAKAAQDQNNDARARDYLLRAKQAYTQALAAQPARSSGERNHSRRQRATAIPAKTDTVAHSNLGEVNLRMGEMANDEGRTEEAFRLYQQAELEFGNAAKVDPNYQFAFTGLGDVYREAGETLGSIGDKARASEYFARSQDHYAQAVRLHNDMAEAYVGLGKVLDDKGQHREALNQYFKATQVRPDLAEPHYHLAVALAPFDPRRAAEQARAFLKIERQPLKQGDKAKTAGDVIEHRPVPVPTVTPAAGVTPPREGLSPSTPTPTPTPTLPPPSPRPSVPVPNVRDKKPDDAIKELRKKGLEGRIEEKADCKATGKALYTEPAKDQMVEVGKTVTVYISTAGPDAVPVPDLRHRPGDDAERELRRLGLTVSYARPVETNSEQEHHVYRQKPDPHKPLMRGCSVELTLAIPVPKVRVPNFVGLTRSEALSRLPRFSFGGSLMRGTITEAERCNAVGKVVEQYPPAGEWVDQGSSVNLVLGKCSDSESPGLMAPNYVVVPPVKNMWYADASKILQSKNLVAEYQYGDCNHYKVSEQTPNAYAKVPPGQHVKLSCPIP